MKRQWHLKTWLKMLLAGWRPDRDALESLALPEGFDLFPEASRVLSQYGGITFSNDHLLIKFDPSLIKDCYGSILSASGQIGLPCYPIGFADGGDYLCIMIDKIGRVYTLNYDPEPFALNFEQAVDFLLRESIGKEEKLEVIQRWETVK